MDEEVKEGSGRAELAVCSRLPPRLTGPGRSGYKLLVGGGLRNGYRRKRVAYKVRLYRGGDSLSQSPGDGQCVVTMMTMEQGRK